MEAVATKLSDQRAQDERVFGVTFFIHLFIFFFTFPNGPATQRD